MRVIASLEIIATVQYIIQFHTQLCKLKPITKQCSLAFYIKQLYMILVKTPWLKDTTCVSEKPRLRFSFNVLSSSSLRVRKNVSWALTLKRGWNKRRKTWATLEVQPKMSQFLQIVSIRKYSILTNLPLFVIFLGRNCPKFMSNYKHISLDKLTRT